VLVLIAILGAVALASHDEGNATEKKEGQ
jgi:hypothetical protein